MKIQILSDIHLEFGSREFDFSEADLLILAGDIHLGTKGLEWILNKVQHIPVLYVLGNHEYYKNAYPKLLYKLKNMANDTNVHILEKDSIEINGVTFHGTTLWTDFELFGNAMTAGYECQQKMSDCKMIRRSPSYSKMRSIDLHLLHSESLKWLSESFATSKTKHNVVITHHAPSIQSIPKQYKNDLVSAGYASNLEDFIRANKPDLWIHGHIHTASDYRIGQTRIICNPAGYPDDIVKGFKKNFIIEFN